MLRNLMNHHMASLLRRGACASALAFILTLLLNAVAALAHALGGGFGGILLAFFIVGVLSILVLYVFSIECLPLGTIQLPLQSGTVSPQNPSEQEYH
jgi:Ca2+/H+ antiporter